MNWIWQKKNWPKFTYNKLHIKELERKFLEGVGGNSAILQHLSVEDGKKYLVEILSSEGVNSAEIEGEILQRESVQSSIRRNLGLPTSTPKIHRKEKAMADLMWKTHTTFDQKLSHKMLFEWHELLMSGDSHISEIGGYRSHEEPMQIVSRRLDARKVFFEAPPSSQVLKEMEQFIEWFNHTEDEMLVKAAVAHLYFEVIHPFEDGNGRIGRALVQKSLSQNLGRPILIAISTVIGRRRKEYYNALGTCNRTLEIDSWIHFFSEIIIEAQEETLDQINFILSKSRIMDSHSGNLNSRQEKVLLRMFAEGTKGFSGGLSAENYISITKTSRATATRDLANLVEKNVLIKSGSLRHTRYWLNLEV